MAEPVIRAVQARSILSRSSLPVGDYSANPYVGCTHGCRYCYASFMKRFTGHAEEWGGFLDVKYWPPISRPDRYAGREIFIGSVTDPYLPQEAVYRRTRALLGELAGSGARISISTKSDLALDDLELIRSFPDARVAWSINTLDEGFRADMDGAAPIERRLAAMRAFHDAGVRTICFISPIFPGITDVCAIIERVKDACNLIWLEDLNLRGGYRADILGYISAAYPQLEPLYREIYSRGGRAYWELLDAQARDCARRLGLEYAVNDDGIRRPFDAPPTVVNYFYHSDIKRRGARLR